jgi:hypothetical protein
MVYRKTNNRNTEAEPMPRYRELSRFHKGLLVLEWGSKELHSIAIKHLPARKRTCPNTDLFPSPSTRPELLVERWRKLPNKEAQERERSERRIRKWLEGIPYLPDPLSPLEMQDSWSEIILKHLGCV